MDAKTNSTSALRDFGSLLEGIINAVDAVVCHLQQEAARHLGLWRACVKQGRSGVRVESARHAVVGLDCGLNVFFVNAQRHAKEHLLRAFRDAAVHAKKVGALKGLEAKIIVAKVSVINHQGVEQFGVFFNDFHYVVGDERSSLTRLGVYKLVHGPHRLREGLVGVLVQVTYRNPRCELGEVGVAHGH